MPENKYIVQKCCPMPFVLRDGIYFGGSIPPVESFIIQEDGFYILQEDSVSKIKLETSI